MTPRKTVAVDADLHALWAAAAKAKGQSLAAYVQEAVEAVRTGSVVRPETQVSGGGIASRGVIVRPKDCTNRLRAGTWCHLCGTVHQGKG